MTEVQTSGFKIPPSKIASLKGKEFAAIERIEQWHDYWGGKIYVSFSGGKDSTVLLSLVRRVYPDTPAVFFNTGLEYPEIVSFIKQTKNVVSLKPKIPFHKVITKYGYPLISKEQAKYIREVQNGTTAYTESKRRGKIKGRNGRPVGAVSKKWQYLMDQQDIKISEKCCDIMKKRPAHLYEKTTGNMPIIGTMTGDSRLRKQSITKYGCNAFNLKKPQSRPISFWTEKDVWSYIKKYDLPYSKIYDMGYERTGCMFCMFGVHLEQGENRFQRMKKTHPKQYNYCINKLGCGKALNLIKTPF